MPDDTITVASRAHTAIQLSEQVPEEFKDKPGMAPPRRAVVINGANHPEARNGVGYTENVDAGLFRTIMDGLEKAGSALHGLFYVKGEEDAPTDPEFGHEPELARVLKANEESDGKAGVTEQKGNVVESTVPVVSADPPGVPVPDEHHE